MTRKAITFTREGAVAILTLNRPERLNAFDQEMILEILGVLREVADDSSVRALVLTGASARARVRARELRLPPGSL